MESQQIQDTTTMRDYLKVLFRHQAVIITTFITVMATVIIGLKFKTPLYQAQVKVLISAVKEIKSPYYRELFRSQDSEVVLTQNEIVKSNPVIERAVQAVQAIGLYQQPLDYEKRFCFNLKKPLIDLWIKKSSRKLARLTEEEKKASLSRQAVEDLKKRIKVEPISDTNLFTISVRDFSPDGAAIIANVVSRSYCIFDLEQQLAEMELKYGEKHPSIIQLKDNIKQMTHGLNGELLSNIKAIGPASVKIVEQAQRPIEPIGPPNLTIILLGLVMSLFLCIILSFVFEYMGQTFKSPQDIERFLNIPYLGSIPRNKKLKKEYLRNLSDQIYLLMKDRNLKSLLLTAALRGEGTTTIIVNIARHLSEKGGHKVLIIDANLRNPSMHKAFNIFNNSGLADVLEGKTPFEQAANDLGSNLNVLTAGKTELNPVTLLGSSRMAKIIEEAKKRYELIFVDCAELKDFKDSAVVSPYLDGTCMVVNEGKTRRQVVKSALAPLEQKKNNLIGAILNNRTFVIPRMIYEKL